MIERATGELRFDDTDTTIGPDLTRETFLASPLGTGASVWVENEPHCSFRTWVRAGAARFVLVLQFHGPTLTGVSLLLDEPRFGSSSWDDWSEEREQARRRAHDAWLEAQLGPPPYRYPWGTVWSDYDPRSGSSSIGISYAQPGQRPRWWRDMRTWLGGRR